MYVAFNELSPSARVWIYQMDKAISASEQGEAEKLVMDFCSQWQAHGSPLRTSFKFEHNHFLILAVDENVGGASGCSIDGSVRLLKEIGTKYNIDFFNRTLAAFLITNEVIVHPLNKLKELFAAGTLSPSVTTFNNLVETKEAFLENWIVPVNQSWLAKYLPKSTLA